MSDVNSFIDVDSLDSHAHESPHNGHSWEWCGTAGLSIKVLDKILLHKNTQHHDGNDFSIAHAAFSNVSVALHTSHFQITIAIQDSSCCALIFWRLTVLVAFA